MTEETQTKLKENEKKCFYCFGSEEIKQVTYKAREIEICKHCYARYYLICSFCDKTFNHELVTYLDNGDLACASCWESDCFRCDDCRGRYATEGNYSEGGLCYSCFDNRNNYLNEIKIPFAFIKSPTFKQNPFKNFCGVEIECNNQELGEKQFNFNQLSKYGFSQTLDGSLEDGISVEYVSNAMNGDLLFSNINAFCRELKSRKFYVDKACGLHIHIGTIKRIEYIRKLLAFYIKFEDIIFKMLPYSRRANHYCRKFKEYYCFRDINKVISVKNCTELKKGIYDTKSLRRISNYSKEKYNDSRYCWFNLHSLFYRGTIEIRSHGGTIEPDKINNWLKLHLTIFNKLKDINLKTIMLLPETEEVFLSFLDDGLKDYALRRFRKFTGRTPTNINRLNEVMN